MKSIYLILTLGLLSCHAALAQNYNSADGWIVATSGDTIRGTILDRTGMNERISFRPEKSAGYREYSPAEVRAFYYGEGYYYKTATIPGPDGNPAPTFLWCLAEGNLTLYRYKDYFYVEKPAGTLTRLTKQDNPEGDYLREDRKFAGILKYLTSDCPAMRGKPDQVKFDAGELAKVVSEYNACIDPTSTPKPSSRSSRFRIKKGVRAGVAIGHLAFFEKQSDYDKFDFETSVGYTAGVLVNFPLVGNLLSFQPEVLLTKKSGTYTGKLNYTTSGRLDIDLTFLQVPVSFYYSPIGKKIRPFVAAGAIFGYAVQRKGIRVDQYRESEIEIQRDEYGFRLGTGVAHRWAGQKQLALEYAFERTVTKFSNDKLSFLSHYITLRTNF